MADNKLKYGYNADINLQVELFERIIMSSRVLSEAIKRAKTLSIDNYYIGAGCVAQTIWNYTSGKPLEYGIDDIDFVYFDIRNLGYEEENRKIVGALICLLLSVQFVIN